jgi:hypothetical protein
VSCYLEYTEKELEIDLKKHGYSMTLERLKTEKESVTARSKIPKKDDASVMFLWWWNI